MSAWTKRGIPHPGLKVGCNKLTAVLPRAVPIMVFASRGCGGLLGPVCFDKGLWDAVQHESRRHLQKLYHFAWLTPGTEGDIDGRARSYSEDIAVTFPTNLNSIPVATS